MISIHRRHIGEKYSISIQILCNRFVPYLLGSIKPTPWGTALLKKLTDTQNLVRKKQVNNQDRCVMQISATQLNSVI
jgi:hypothetical protein